MLRIKSTPSARGPRIGPRPTSPSSRPRTSRRPAPLPPTPKSEVNPRGPQARGIFAPLRGFVALLCGLALLGLGCAHRSEPAAPPSAQSAAPTAASHVLLWRAQLGPSTVHFLGSVH